MLHLRHLCFGMTVFFLASSKYTWAKVIMLVCFSFQIEYDHSMTNGKLRDFCDGSFYKNHLLFSSNSSALQIMMYFDEFDVCDPLGSKSSKYKIGLFSLAIFYSERHIALNIWHYAKPMTNRLM